MADIVICEFMDVTAVDDLARDFDVLYDPDLVDRHQELSAAARNAGALIVRNRTQVRGAFLEGCADLRVVGRLGVGLDNIDLEACGRRGIKVCPATGANDVAVAEYVITTALLLLRQAYMAGPEVIAGNWPRQQCMGREIGGKVLGLVGYGGIARQTAQRAGALGMHVMAYDPHVNDTDPAWRDVERVALDGLLARADVISLHVPLTAETRGLFDRQAIAQMQTGSILINTSRGGIVDEHALIEAIRSKHLAGAALDVFETEPVTVDSGEKFSNIPNLLLTPHIAGVTHESNIRVSAVTAAHVREALNRP